MKLKVLHNTVFKQSSQDSSQLTDRDKVTVRSRRVFRIHSWKILGSYLKVALLGEFLGSPPRNTWYVYIPHIQLINDRGQVVAIQQNSPSRSTSAQPLPPTKVLNVPYKNQLDNALNPNGACNVTSFAMVMQYFQVHRRTSQGQLEDELYRFMENSGLSRWEPDDLARLAKAYKLEDDFTTRGRLYDIRKAIAEGRPCIIHGYFTSFGHIIVVRGYDQNGFWINDPFGEWTADGYRQDIRGANLHYSDRLIQSKCSPEGDDYIWLHRLSN
jgi:uncharacterized protein YvpB